MEKFNALIKKIQELDSENLFKQEQLSLFNEALEPYPEIKEALEEFSIRTKLLNASPKENSVLRAYIILEINDGRKDREAIFRLYKKHDRLYLQFLYHIESYEINNLWDLRLIMFAIKDQLYNKLNENGLPYFNF